MGSDRERRLLQHGPAAPAKEVPTLQEFASKFLNGYARANRKKPSGIASKETIIRAHLLPLLGAKKLDAISNEVVQGVTHALREKAPRTVNNVLTVLNQLPKTAVEWNVLDRMPCAIRLRPLPKSSAWRPERGAAAPSKSAVRIGVGFRALKPGPRVRGRIARRKIPSTQRKGRSGRQAERVKNASSSRAPQDPLQQEFRGQS